MDFNTFFKINSALSLSIFTQLSVVINAADHEIQNAVLGKADAFTVPEVIHLGV